MAAFESEFVESAGELGLIQIGAGPFLIPPGDPGDTIVLWLLCSPNWNTSDLDTLDTITQWDSSPAEIDSLTVDKTQPLDGTDGVLYVAHGTRITDLDQVQVLFSPETGPTAYIIANFPPGTWVDAGEDDTYTSHTGTFTPTGGPTLDLSMNSPANLLRYAHALQSGANYAGVVVSWWETGAGSPIISGPGSMQTEQVDDELFSMRAFALGGRKWWVGVAGWGG